MQFTIRITRLTGALRALTVVYYFTISEQFHKSVYRRMYYQEPQVPRTTICSGLMLVLTGQALLHCTLSIVPVMVQCDVYGILYMVALFILATPFMSSLGPPTRMNRITCRRGRGDLPEIEAYQVHFFHDSLRQHCCLRLPRTDYSEPGMLGILELFQPSNPILLVGHRPLHDVPADHFADA